MSDKLEPQVTLGVSSKGNTPALQLCLSSVINAPSIPDRIQIRLEGTQPGFNSFYLEQICELARIYNIEVSINVFQSTGVRDSRDWQIRNCKTPYLWLVDDDVVVDYRCLSAYLHFLLHAKELPAFLAGSKSDVNNRRGYPNFDTSKILGPSFMHIGKDHNHSLRYDVEDCFGLSAPTQVLDTGNCLLRLQPIKDKGCMFRQFPDQANPSGDATTFSLVLAKAGLKGMFVPSAAAYHLEKPGGGFNEFQARYEMLLRTCDVKGFDKSIINKYWMPAIDRV
jgi:hypothetical protein